MEPNHYSDNVLQWIANIIFMNAENSDNFGLNKGYMGNAIFLYNYGRESGEKIYTECADHLLGKIYEKINSKTSIDFDEGLLGVRWGFEYLIKHGFVEFESDDIFKEIDDMLWDYKVNSLHDIGLLNGYLLFFITRYKRSECSIPNLIELEAISQIISSLIEDCLQIFGKQKNSGFKSFDLPISFLNTIIFSLYQINNKQITFVGQMELLSFVVNNASMLVVTNSDYADLSTLKALLLKLTSCTIYSLHQKDLFKIIGLIDCRLGNLNITEEKVVNFFPKQSYLYLIYNLDFENPINHFCIETFTKKCVEYIKNDCQDNLEFFAKLTRIGITLLNTRIEYDNYSLEKTQNTNDAGISVIMPTFNQAPFIAMAIQSLMDQTYHKWELIIINDGCLDNTEEVVSQFNDKRIRYFKNSSNIGLGASLNLGIEKARFYFIAYLPSDDIIFPDHLKSLLETLFGNPKAIFSFSGIKNINYNLSGTIENCYSKVIEGRGLQLVQILHRKVNEKWVERSEFVSDDYFLMYWNKLLYKGPIIPTNVSSCQWVNHPDQRHKKICTNYGGGLNVYRRYYNVSTPLKFKPKNENLWDEEILYKDFRKEQTKVCGHLKILIVGELAFNPERIYALEEAGHELYGLWIDSPWCFQTVGPLPFGNVIEISRKNWKETLKQIKPDIIYALLNTPSISLAAEVLKLCPTIPFIWHFKEGPFYGRQTGQWNLLQFLQTRSDGIIYINDEVRNFYNICFPEGKQIDFMILDGDLPKANWFKKTKKPLLSEKESGFHTVVPGRPYGIKAEHVGLLAKENIHFHFYGENWHGAWVNFVKSSQAIAPNHIHLHPNCDPKNWTEELSQYDAGWLHYFESRNGGNYLKTDWNDLNIPARMSTLAAAGLPMLQHDNTGHIVATQSICKNLDIGIFFNDFIELGDILSDNDRMQQIKNNVWKHRMKFSFDYHVPELIDFFREIIAKKKTNKFTYLLDGVSKF